MKETLRNDLTKIIVALQELENPFAENHVDAMISKSIVTELKHIATQYYTNIDTLVMEMGGKQWN